MVLWSRKAPRSHTELCKDELTQSYDHLKLAAGHAAGGAAERVGPTYDRARLMAMDRMAMTRGALTPLYEQMRQGALNARKGEIAVVRKNRWPMLAGLLAAGAAVGAAGAIVARKRRAAAEWDEFEPLGGIEADYGLPEHKGSAGKKLTDGAASVAGSVSASASKIADSLHGRSARASDSLSEMKDTMSEQAKRNGKA